MDKIMITDDMEMKERIGREVYEKNKSIYNERRMRIITSEIEKYYPACSEEEKRRVFYLSLYDYWVYGATIDQYYYYNFAVKSHIEKSGYLTFWNRFDFYEKLNNRNDRYILRNKYEAYKRLKEYYGRDVLLLRGGDDYDLFAHFVDCHPKFIVKPVDLSRSEGVHIDRVSEYTSKRDVFDRLMQERRTVDKNHKAGEHQQALVLEELIIQHEALSILHPSSVNAVRIPTVRVDGTVKFFYPWIKIGTGSATVVCGAADGMDAGINIDTGVIETDGYDEFGHVYEYHPDTGVKIKGYVIPRWDELKQLIKIISDKVPTFGYVGWDMVLTNDGWIVMEGNDSGDFLSQLVWNKGLKREFEDLIGWKPAKEFWWEDKDYE